MQFASTRIGDRSGWRGWITLACVFAFLIVSLGHAGKHLSPVAPASSSVEFVLLQDSDNSGDTVAVAEEICTFCALGADSLKLASFVKPAFKSNALSLTSELHTSRHITAEPPPPIA